MTIKRMIELLQIEKACITRNDGVNCDRNCTKCDLVQDSKELLKMYNKVIDELHKSKAKDKEIEKLQEENDYLKLEILNMVEEFYED